MNVNRRTALLLVIVLVVIVGVYAITQWQRTRETGNLLGALRSTDHSEATKAMTALRDRGGSIQEQLIANMSGADDQLRWRSAVLLGSIHSTAARDALEAGLKDPYDDVRMNSALGLGKLGEGRAAEELSVIAVNADESPAVRTAAVRALALLRSGPHLPELAQLAADRPPVYPEGEEPEEVPVDETVLLRQAAVIGVGVLGTVASDDVASRVGDGGSASAAAAMQVLADSASAALEPNAEVRAVACTSVADLARAATDDDVTTSGIRCLISALDDQADVVRIAAAHALGLIRAPSEMQDQVASALERCAGDSQYWVREAVADNES
jgi:hypothetical protein